MVFVLWAVLLWFLSSSDEPIPNRRMAHPDETSWQPTTSSIHARCQDAARQDKLSRRVSWLFGWHRHSLGEDLSPCKYLKLLVIIAPADNDVPNRTIRAARNEVCTFAVECIYFLAEVLNNQLTRGERGRASRTIFSARAGAEQKKCCDDGKYRSKVSV